MYLMYEESNTQQKYLGNEAAKKSLVKVPPTSLTLESIQSEIITQSFSFSSRLLLLRGVCPADTDIIMLLAQGSVLPYHLKLQVRGPNEHLNVKLGPVIFRLGVVPMTVLEFQIPRIWNRFEGTNRSCTIPPHTGGQSLDGKGRHDDLGLPRQLFSAWI